MDEPRTESLAKRFSRLFRKGGVLLGKEQYAEALVVFREGEALALLHGDEQRLLLFREEIVHCTEQLNK